MDQFPQSPERLTPPQRESTRRQATGTKLARTPQSRVLGLVRGAFSLTVAGLGAASIVGGVILWSIYSRYTADLPTIDGLRTYKPPMMSRIYASNGEVLAELATERRVFVPLASIPVVVRQAFLAAEDQNFFSHHGVDPYAILRAAYTDLGRIGEQRRPVGASTITQQVARNMLLGSNALSFERKVREALLALRIEHALSKDRILELYLNEIYLGQGAYGVAAASQAYFDKPLNELSAAEAASLAALPKSPSNYNLIRFPEAAEARRNWVLDRMVDTHAISPDMATRAKASPLLPTAYRKPQAVAGAEWFTEEVRRRLVDRFGQDQATEGGLIVQTSFDSRLQDLADRALRDGLVAYDESHGGWGGPLQRLPSNIVRGDWADALSKISLPAGCPSEWRLAVVLQVTARDARIGSGEGALTPTIGDLSWSSIPWTHAARPDGTEGAPLRRMSDVVQAGDVILVEPPSTAGTRTHLWHLRQIPKVTGALVSLDPNTGRVLAMSGGWSGAVNQFNRATQAQRQPGSSFKPFVYLTALEQGISPRDTFSDAPFSLGTWHPNNYEMNFGGPTPLHVALEQSLNLVTVRVAQKVGMSAVAKTATDFHLVASMPRVLPAALGAVETTVLREAGAYASLAEQGHDVVPSLIDSVQDSDGRVIWRPQGLVENATNSDQPPELVDTRAALTDPASAYQVVLMMEGVMKNGTGAPVAKGFDRPLAGKTGTTQDYNDAWLAGFSPDLVTVVWVGFDQPQSLGDEQTGAAVAGPIWRHFMQDALRDRPVLDFRTPSDVSLYSWGCGRHACVDAFKPGQEPAGHGDAVASDAESNDAVKMLDADPDGGQHPASADKAVAQTPDTGTGIDSGVGGIY